VVWPKRGQSELAGIAATIGHDHRRLAVLGDKAIEDAHDATTR
jgi:hypothetical protein